MNIENKTHRIKLKLKLKLIVSFNLIISTALFNTNISNAYSAENTDNKFTIDVLWKNPATIGINIEGLNDEILNIVDQDFKRSGKISLQNNANYSLKSIVTKQNNINQVSVNLFKDNASLGGIKINSTSTSAIGHRISDFIYEKLFNKKGVFSTRLSYVVQKNKEFMLMISDSDGGNANVALKSREPIISVTWSPSGREVAYVSFENKKPVVYIHHISSGSRRVIANYAGNNSAPSWSPDSRYLALALSVNGNTQIYRVNTDGSNLKRLSYSSSPVIDTEPQYSPDGKHIYFTSDRGAEPQIYKMNAEGEQTSPAQRITFSGNHNTSARISPNGEYLAYISQGQGQKIYLKNLKDGTTYSPSKTFNDESPSFAANGDYLIYSSIVNGKHTLIATDIENKNSYVLSIPYSKVSQPTWGPFMQ